MTEIAKSINAREIAARQSESINVAAKIFDSLAGNDLVCSPDGAQTIYFGDRSALKLDWVNRTLAFQGVGLDVKVVNLSKINPRNESVEAITPDLQTTLVVHKEGQIILDSRDRREVRIEMENTEPLVVESDKSDSIRQEETISLRSNMEGRESTFVLGASGIVRFESHLKSEQSAKVPENVIFASFDIQDKDEDAA